jgi:hypothetical protein
MDRVFVHRFRSFLQYAIPFTVVCDTARSFYVVGQLAEQRLRTWQDEADKETARGAKEVLLRVASRCAAKDNDFWPAEINARLALTPLGSSASDQAAAALGAELDVGDVWSLLTATTKTTVEETSSASQTLEQQQQHGPSSELSAQRAQRPATRIVYVTLSGAMAQLVGSMHIMGGGAEGGSRAAHGIASMAEAAGQQLRTRVTAAADGVRDVCAARLPWPEMVLQRRSALRGRVDWRGMRRPSGEESAVAVAGSLPGSGGLEVCLDGL